MARIIPSDISRLALAGARTPELDTLRVLKDRLSNDYTVFHGVHWSNAYAASTVFGEIDFVVLDRAGGVLVIEQKNGPLAETDEGLVKRYGQTAKNVAGQLHRTLDGIRRKFAWQHGEPARLGLDYLLYCPDHRVRDLNAAGLDARRIVDAGADLAERVQALLARPAADPTQHARVHAFFCQSFALVADIDTHIARQEEGFVHQVGALAELFANLEMEPFRLRVLGTAGCGKSLLARRFVERVAATGGRPLLLCYNRPLGDALRAQMPADGVADTFYGFCNDFLKSRGDEVDFTAMSTHPDFWGGVQERVMALRIPDAWRFDALAVDEGQDFEPEWWEIAQLFLRDAAPVLWLEDQDQNLYGKEPAALPGFVRYRARVNYRSPERIARFIRDVLKFRFEIGNALPGQRVRVHGWDEAAEQLALVAGIVETLRAAGFADADIALVSCRGLEHSAFARLERVGDARLRRFTGNYDEAGHQVWTAGTLLSDSVYRFKGRDAPAVILVDADPDPERLAHWYRLLYCAMTRATVRLEVLVKRTSAVGEELLAAARHPR